MREQVSFGELRAMAGGQLEDRLLSHYADIEEIAQDAESILAEQGEVALLLMDALENKKPRELIHELKKRKSDLAFRYKINRIRNTAAGKGATVMQSAVRRYNG